MTKGLMEPPTAYDATLSMIMGALAGQVVGTLAQLSIAEHLEPGPLTAEQVAQRESSDPMMTLRLLRAATALGLLIYEPVHRTFAATPRLRVLREDSPDSLKNYAIHVAGPAVYLPAMRLRQAVVDGTTQSVQAVGAEHFEYLSQHPKAAAIFSAAMTDVSAPLIRAAMPHINVAEARYALDVGGAEGVFVKHLVEANAHLRGAVFDLPHVIDRLGAELGSVSGRIDGVAGDFFKSVPPADIYLMKFILHDWDDAACVTLLTNIRAAMRKDARVIIFEMMINESHPDPYATLLDMVMMTAMGGRERTIAEYDLLLDSAGLRRTDLIGVRSSYQLLVATAA